VAAASNLPGGWLGRRARAAAAADAAALPAPPPAPAPAPPRAPPAVAVVGLVYTAFASLLNPPPGLYATPLGAGGAAARHDGPQRAGGHDGRTAASRPDWSERATLSAPRFAGFNAHFPGAPHAPGMCAVVEVRAAGVYAPPLGGGAGNGARGRALGAPFPVGWALLPLLDPFEESYVARGAYALPLFAGKPSPRQLAAIRAALSAPLSLASVLAQLLGTAPPSHPALASLAGDVVPPPPAAAAALGRGVGGSRRAVRGTSAPAPARRLRAALHAVLAAYRFAHFKRALAQPLPHHNASAWPPGEAPPAPSEWAPHAPLLRLLPGGAALLARVNDAQLEGLCTVEEGDAAYEPPPSLQLPAELADALGAPAPLPPPAAGGAPPPPRDAPAKEVLAYALTGALPPALAGHPALRRSSVAGFGASLRGGAPEAVSPPPFQSQKALERAILANVEEVTGVRVEV
jgi:hypothetical protein